MMTQGWVVKGPAERFSSTVDYIAGSYYRVMPSAPNIVLCRQMFYICSLSGLIAWSGLSYGKKRIFHRSQN